MPVMEASTGTLLEATYQEKQKENKKFTGAKSFLERAVPYKMAMECVRKYEQTALGNMKKKTQGVIFKKNLLEKWIKDVDAISTYDEMDIRFGIYTQDFVDETPEDDDRNVDKITVFLFPTLNGAPARRDKSMQDENVDPFNMGEVYP